MFANAQKKNSAMFTFSLDFFEKAHQQQQQPNTYFFFQKDATESWFENKWEVVFFFLFSHLQKKKGVKIKRQIVFFFCVEQKHCEVWTKNKSPSHSKKLKYFFVSLCFFAFRQQQKTFPFLPLAS